jgi:SAM-dependent methyltransferase
MAEFDPWAKYYDVIHVGLSGEMEFYRLKCLERGGSVLELGSGTGRILLPLATEGVHVTGLEQSTKMIEVCVAKMKNIEGDFSTATLVEGDMRNFKFDDLFDTIIMPYRTLMHIVRPEQQLQCLESIRKHLKPDGRVFLNVWLPDYGYIHFFKSDGGESDLNFVDRYPLPDSENHIDHFHKVISYPVEQRLVEEHTLVELDPNNREIDRQALPMMRTWFSIPELNWLIQCAGLEVVNVWGDFEEGPIDSDSEESVWELKLVHRSINDIKTRVR